jgi:hypothetical protein
MHKYIYHNIFCLYNFYHFRSHYGPGVDSASNRNEYQECFQGVKAAGAQSWQPCHLHVPIVMRSGSLDLLEPSGPVKACNGIALPLPLHVSTTVYHLQVGLVCTQATLTRDCVCSHLDKLLSQCPVTFHKLHRITQQQPSNFNLIILWNCNFNSFNFKKLCKSF